MRLTDFFKEHLAVQQQVIELDVFLAIILGLELDHALGCRLWRLLHHARVDGLLVVDRVPLSNFLQKQCQHFTQKRSTYLSFFSTVVKQFIFVFS